MHPYVHHNYIFQTKISETTDCSLLFIDLMVHSPLQKFNVYIICVVGIRFGDINKRVNKTDNEKVIILDHLKWMITIPRDSEIKKIMPVLHPN